MTVGNDVQMVRDGFWISSTTNKRQRKPWGVDYAENDSIFSLLLIELFCNRIWLKIAKDIKCF
jgi:hypothetical protein